MKAVEQGFYNQTMQENMLKLESEKADLQWRIDGEKLNAPVKLDYDKIVYWLEQFASGDIDDPKFRERIIDGFINKVIVWNDKIVITYNILGKDGKAVSVAQIIKDFEHIQKESNPEKFDSFPLGAGGGT